MDTRHNTCSICITSIGDTNTCALDCGHSFHYNCLFTWNTQNRTCPICRTEVNIEPDPQHESHIQQELQNSIDFREIIQNSNQHGFKVQCKECESFLVECHHCKEKMCNCVANNYRNHEYFNMKNPFSNTDSEINTCASCFFERDNLILQHINSPNINLDEYLYNNNFESLGDDPFIKELYETYYTNDSNITYNLQVYGNNFREYRDYESFISYIEMIHEHEIHRENWNLIPIENINYIEEIPINDNINIEDIYNYLFMNNISTISNVPRNIPRNISNLSNIMTRMN